MGTLKAIPVGMAEGRKLRPEVLVAILNIYRFCLARLGRNHQSLAPAR